MQCRRLGKYYAVWCRMCARIYCLELFGYLLVVQAFLEVLPNLILRSFSPSDLPILSPGPVMSSHTPPSSTINLVAGHYRVGRKIGEGSFGVIFEGLSSCQASRPAFWASSHLQTRNRNQSPQLTECSYQICMSALLENQSTVHRHHLYSPPYTQEPRKAEAPQLRDECRSYRILSGCREYHLFSATNRVC